LKTVVAPFVQPEATARPRVIVVLTTLNGRLVRTRQFKKPAYVGDPINAVKIFSDKGADELVLLEIGGGPLDDRRKDLIQCIASEALMPISYGGGIRTIEHVRAIIRCGFEKVILNAALHKNLELATQAAAEYGSQAVVGAIEVKTTWFRGKHVRTNCGRLPTRIPVVEWAQRCADAGCGELLLTSIDADGSMAGYDLSLISDVAAAVNVPVVALGGAGNAAHLKTAIAAGASAVAAGSMFVFFGTRRAVLITYPTDLFEE